jgi:hypothetical protein
VSRIQIFAYAVLAALALYVFGTVAMRMHDGRCVPRVSRLGLDCSYPNPAPPAVHPHR